MRNETLSPTTRRRPRRTLNRLALTILALAFGLAGQALWRQESLWDGLLLTAIGAAIFWRAAKPHSQKSAVFSAANIVLAGGWRRGAGAGLLALAMILSVIGLRLFDNAAAMPSAWQFYGGSLLALVGGTLLLTPASSRFSTARVRSFTTFALGAILLAALAMRIWHFAQLPFGIWYDEAEAGLQARQWLSNPAFKPAFYPPINISGQLIWLYSLGLRVSDTVWGLRLISVLFGLGGVLAGFLFGREVRGARFGLALAFLLAVMRWDVNFSRIAMTGIDTPFFELLALFFLARALKRHTLRDAIFAGIAFGAGLSFYTAFRLFVAAVGIFVALAALFGRIPHRQWKTIALQIAALAIVAWIVLMPVAQFAIRQPEAYWLRVQTTSIWNRRDDPNLPHALLTSTLKHAKMFTIHGDNNGRHNLPGEPELDPLMGVLFIFGLLFALKNMRRAENSFFLLLLPIGLAGGILSLDFEAPQSLRSIAALPAVAFFAALPLDWLLKEGRETLAPLSRKWKIVPVGIVALYLIGFNAHTYFVRQANSFAVWNAFSTPETITGQKMAQLGANTDFFLSPFLANHPTIQFLAPNSPHTTIFELPDALPIRTDAQRPAALFIHPDDGWLVGQARRLYPAAKFDTISNAPENPPAVHTVQLSPADISAVQGLGLSLWTGTDTSAPPAQAFRAETVRAPQAVMPPPFTAVWEGTLYAPRFGVYGFALDSDGQALLEIDGYSVLAGSGDQSAERVLAEGNHHFRLETTVTDLSAPFGLQWQPPGETFTEIPRRNLYLPPVETRGLLGQYFPNENWSGPPALERVDPLLSIYFHLTPLPRPYSVRWSGSLVVPETGIYRLQLKTVGEAALLLDNQQILHTNLPGVPFEQVLSLTAGLHPIAVEFVDNVARSEIQLAWIPPNTDIPVLIPPENLLPPTGSAWEPFTAAQTVAQFEPKPLRFNMEMALADGLSQPRDVAVGADGTIFVADSGIAGIHLFAANGTTLGAWTETGDGALTAPFGVVAAPDGSVWALDSDRQQIYGFSADGAALGGIVTPEAQLYNPRGLSLVNDPTGAPLLAVANTGTGNLVFFGLDGTLRGKLGSFGDAPGQFNEPVDVLQDTFGAYFVTEGANANRWQRVDALGNPLGMWELPMPVAFDGGHLATAPDGSLLMTDSARGVVRRFAPDGSLLEEWSGLGEAVFQRPAGIFMDGDAGRLFITDIGAGVVYVFRVEVEG